MRKKKKLVKLNLDSDVIAWLRVYAAQTGQSFSDVVSEALREFIDNSQTRLDELGVKPLQKIKKTYRSMISDGRYRSAGGKKAEGLRECVVLLESPHRDGNGHEYRVMVCRDWSLARRAETDPELQLLLFHHADYYQDGESAVIAAGKHARSARIKGRGQLVVVAPTFSFPEIPYSKPKD